MLLGGMPANSIHSLQELGHTYYALEYRMKLYKSFLEK